MTFNPEWLSHPDLLVYWALLLTVGLEKLWAWPEKSHPLSFGRLLAERMADKVNPAKRRDADQNNTMQQYISGSLSIIMLLLPFAIILILFIQLAEFPIFFDALLLFIALQFQTVMQSSQKVSDMVAARKLVLARETLGKLTLRETNKLSALGLIKANIEALLLRFNHQYACTLFWYFVAGGTAALCYRLLYEFSHVWHTRLGRFYYFGQPAAKLTALLQWLPTRLNLATFALAQDMSGTLRGLRSAPPKRSSRTLLLACQGGALGVELGGPAYYSGSKIREPKCGGQREIKHGDLTRTIKAIKRNTVVLLCFYFLCSAAAYAQVNRIVSLAPHTTELVYALDAQAKLIAVSDFSNYPAEAAKLPSVANHSGVDFEQIIRLKPDLILAWKGGNKPQDLARLESLGFRIFYSQPTHPADISQEIRILGTLLNKPRVAGEIAERFDQQLSEIKQRYAKAERITAFYYMWPKPLMTIGENAWATRLLNICGATNIFADALSDYPEVGVEEVLRRQPQRLVAAMNTTRKEAELFWQPWRELLKAPLSVADPDLLHRFTPRLINGLSDLCEQIRQN